MRFDGIKIRGLGPFAEEVSIDLTSIAGPLVAVCGENGAGKSTLLELFAGALYRRTPTRGTLSELATTRDAFVEARVVNGKSWLLRHTVDGTSGKGESLVLDEHGTAVLSSAKVREFDTWAGAHLPASEVFYASCFAVQGSSGFLGLSAGDRKAVLLRALGIEHLESRAEAASLAARDARGAAAALAGRLQDARGGALPVADAQAALDGKRAGAATRDGELAAARAALRAAEEGAAAAREARQRAEQATAAREAAARALGAAQGDLAALDARRDTESAIACRGAAIRGAAEQLRVLVADEAIAQEELRVIEQRARDLARDAAEIDRAADAATASAEEARVRVETRLCELRDRIAAQVAIVADREERIRRNRGDILGRADAIRAAVARSVEIDGRSAAIAAVQERAQTAIASAARDGAAHAQRQADARRRGAAATTALRAATSRSADRETIARAVANLPAALAALVEAETAVSAEVEQLDRLRGTRLQGADDRVLALRGALGAIAALDPVVATEAPRLASKAVADDDTTVALAASLPDQIAAAERSVADARSRLGVLNHAAVDLERMAAKAGEIDALDRETSALTSTIDEATAQERDEAAAQEVAQQAGLDAATTHSTLQAELEALAAERAALRPDLALADRLPGAEERIAGLQREIDGARAESQRLDAERDEAQARGIAEAKRGAQAIETQRAQARARWADATAIGEAYEVRRSLDAIALAKPRLVDAAGELDRLARAEAALVEIDAVIATARGRVADAERALAGLPIPSPVPAEPDTEQPEAALVLAEGAARLAHAEAAVAARDLEAALAVKDRVATLEVELRAAEVRVADLVLLNESLGRNGLQAALIDAAGPELTKLVNDLLHTCVGPRWTVTIEAARTSADGKRELAGCEVRVLDTERGRDADAESLSGGERVLVGEAISLALTMLACRRSGVRGPTLIRDETGAALDPARAQAWISMLRRAVEIVGASLLLFVSHSPEVQALADSRLVIADGRVGVE